VTSCCDRSTDGIVQWRVRASVSGRIGPFQFKKRNCDPGWWLPESNPDCNMAICTEQVLGLYRKRRGAKVRRVDDAGYLSSATGEMMDYETNFVVVSLRGTRGRASGGAERKQSLGRP